MWGNARSPGAAAVAGPSDDKVPAEDVVAAARLAAAGQPFEVVHYPRASTPEFSVHVAAVKESMQVSWCPGLRLKMEFETEDLSRISWFMAPSLASRRPIQRGGRSRPCHHSLHVLPPKSEPQVNRGGYFFNFIGDLGRA